MPMMFPLEKRYDPTTIDGKFSAFSKLPCVIQVSITAPIAKGGYGKATVDGIELSGTEMIEAVGFKLLLVPVGEVAREYDKTYTVKLEGFTAEGGKKFPTCTFKLKTAARKVQNPKYVRHDEQALIAAREGMVLLKNEGNILPIKPDSVLNCFGIGQHQYRITATGASLINPRWKPTFMEAVADHSRFSVNEELAEFYKSGKAGTPERAMLERTKAKSDTALIFLTRHSGEMQDNRPIKGQYYLSDREMEMVKAVAEIFDKTVLILNTGYPVDMRWTKELGIKSILYTGFAGMLSSYALVEILDGRTNPSGKISDTWPWDYYDNIVSKNQPVLDEGAKTPADADLGVHIYYEEDIYVGYRYFDTFGVPAAFSFGHGLSYTTFDKTVSGFERTEHGVALDVTVTNTGTCDGKEVVQLYLSAPAGKLEKPAHVLCGFEKTKLLAPGESETLHLEASDRDFASFDEERTCYLLERGKYTAYIGNIGCLTLAGSFDLAEDCILKTVRHYGLPVEELKRLTKDDPTVDGTKSRIVDLKNRIPVSAERTAYEPQALPKYSGPRISWEMLKANPELLDAFVAQMTDDELCAMNVCAGARWAPWQDGAAGGTAELKQYGLPSFTVSDANAGLNLKKTNIGFPASSVIAATFNKEIAYTVGKVIAEESLENGVFSNLGPGMNLHRNQLNGRHPEYFSEDPYLVGTMAGWHGKGLEENGVGCCYKHLFCNGSDLSRKGSQSIVPERALRELYFRAFERAFEVHKPSSVMTSYNALNGLYPAENAELLQGLVREEWGFDGWIMSDWDAYEAIDAVEMVKAGNCWITSGGKKWIRTIQKARKGGRISRAVLENNVRWLVKTLLHWAK